jgi:hypothetical protein
VSWAQRGMKIAEQAPEEGGVDACPAMFMPG